MLKDRQLIIGLVIDICGTHDLYIHSSTKDKDLQLRGVLNSKFFGPGP